MAAYDNVSLPGAPNIATAGNYAQMLYEMGKGLGQAYQAGDVFRYQQQLRPYEIDKLQQEQRMRDLFQTPQGQAALKRAMETGDYSAVLMPVIAAGGGATAAELLPKWRQMELQQQYLNRPAPWPGATPDDTQPPNAPYPGIRPAASSATGVGGITGIPPGRLATTSPTTEGDRGGDTVQSMAAGIASSKYPDLDIPPGVIRMWARDQFGLPGPDAPLPDAARGKMSSLIDSYAAAKGLNAPGRIPYSAAGGGPPGAGGGSIPSGVGVSPAGPLSRGGPGAGTSMPMGPAPVTPAMPPPGAVAGGPPPAGAMSPSGAPVTPAPPVRPGIGPGAGPAVAPAGPPPAAPAGMPIAGVPPGYDPAAWVRLLRNRAQEFRQQGNQEERLSQVMTGRGGGGQGYFSQADKLNDQANKVEEQLTLSSGEREAARLGMSVPQYEQLKERNKLATARYDKLQSSNAALGRSADEMAGHLQVMHSVLDSPDLFTGPGHEPIEYMRKAVANFMPQWIRSGLGITATTTPNEALRKVTAANVLNQTNMLRDDAAAIGGSGGAVRVAQIELMQKAAQSPDSSIPALRLLTELGDRAAVQGKVIARMTQDYVRAHGGLDVNFERQMSDWYEQHPLLSPEEEHDIRYLSAPRVPSSVKTDADAKKWAAKLGMHSGDPVRVNRSTLKEFDSAKPGQFPARYTTVP